MNISVLQVAPIVAALKRHKAAVVLLVLEIALTMAVLGNLVFVVHGSIRRSHTPTGIAETQVGVIQSIGVIGAKETGTIGNNLVALRAVHGVTNAAFGGPPLWSSYRAPVFRDPSHQQRVGYAYLFGGSQGFSRTLGLHVVQGHDFEDSALPSVGTAFAAKHGARTTIPVLVTRSLCRKLYGSANPVGRMLYGALYGAEHQMRVIGVVDHLRGAITGRTGDDDSIVIEFHVGPEQLGGGFMIRAGAGHLQQTLHSAAIALGKVNSAHVQAKIFTFSDFRAEYFRNDLAVGRMLMAIMLILLLITSLGVGGLASFWVQQRRRQIGMRRALGATQGDILGYFLIENFLIVSGGVLLGTVCTYALNFFLMQRFELPRLPLIYLPIGALALWLLGQLAVLGPALRAARVPPVVATRAV